MEDRRSFLKATVAAAAVSRSILGANDRIQMAIIGTGERGGQVYRAFTQHKDQVFVAACDVASDSLDEFVTRAGKMSTYKDYRRILERKDVDAVLITTPDHWHAPMLIEACQAGKDCYVEKPISNAVEPAKQMVDAAIKYKRVTQVGTWQRSQKHFLECVKMVQDGYIGQVTHILIPHQGSYTAQPQAPAQPPDSLDWEMWQGPAPHHPYKPSRLFFRTYYDYSGGIVSDQGVHFVDSANHIINNDTQGPLLTSGVGQYTLMEPDLEQIPDSIMCQWKYPKYTAAFVNMNFFPPAAPGDLDMLGTFLYGTKGVLHVNRSGYDIRPSMNRGPRRNADPGDRNARGGRPDPKLPRPPMSGGPAIEAKSFRVTRPGPNEPREDPTANHVRNFLDCIKSRQQCVCHIDVGFHSSLPCILGVQAVREGRQFAWDEKTRTVTRV